MNAPTTSFGHNEQTARLGLLAEDAMRGLERVAAGEADAIDGWLAYGAALNEGRKQFHPEDDKGFGQWVEDNLLHQVGTVEVRREERAAAMWAAANPNEFAEARAAGNARTVRGIHAKWKEIEAQREAEAERQRAEAARAEAQANANAEAKASRDVEEARDDDARRDALERQERAREAREVAQERADKAESDAVRRDPSALREGLREAMNERPKRPSNRNPLHRADASRDRVISFTGDCRRVAQAEDIEQLAAFSGHEEFRRQMIEEARAAHAILAQLIKLAEIEDAEI